MWGQKQPPAKRRNWQQGPQHGQQRSTDKSNRRRMPRRRPAVSRIWRWNDFWSRGESPFTAAACANEALLLHLGADVNHGDADG